MASFGPMSSVWMSGLKGVGISSGQAGSSGIFYTTDGGIGWTASDLTTGIGSGGYVPNYICIDGNNAVAVCSTLSPYTVYYSTNGGQTWLGGTYLSNPLSINGQVAVAISGTNAFVAGQAGVPYESYYSTNGGATWAVSTGLGGVTQLYGLQMIGNNAVAGTENGVYFSTDGGVTWTVSTGNVSDYTLSISMNAAGNVVIGQNSGVLYSTDFGANVTVATTGVGGMSNRMTISIDSGSQKCIAASSTTSTLWYSSDGGNNWTNSTQSISAEIALMISGNYAIAGSSGSSLYSTDAGQTWIVSTTPISNVNTGCRYLIGQKGIMSDASALYYSGDAGNNWVLAQSPPPPPPPPPIVCFKEGSKILTEKGYIAVQDLRNGDLIKTVSSGFKKIEHIGYSKMYNNVNEIRSNDKLYRCSTSEYPELSEDLIITGCHAILIKNFKDQEQIEKTQEVLGKIYITDKHYRLPACVDERTKIFEEEGVHTIWHFSLEHSDYYMNYGVYANGLLVETTSNRMMLELSGMTLV